MTMFAAAVGDEYGDRRGECERCDNDGRAGETWAPGGPGFETWRCPDYDEVYVRRALDVTAAGVRR